MATLGKAFGTFGAFVAGSDDLIETLIQDARTWIYTTAPPAAHCAGVQAALDIVITEPQRRQRLRDNGAYFREQCRDMGLDTGNSESYIVPIILGDIERTMAIARALNERGFLIWPMRPPTVTSGTCRLRISLMSEHTRDDLDALIMALREIIPT